MHAQAPCSGAAEQQQAIGSVGGEGEGELLLGKPRIQAGTGLKGTGSLPVSNWGGGDRQRQGNGERQFIIWVTELANASRRCFLK